MVLASVGPTLANLFKSAAPAAGLGIGLGAGSAAGGSAVSVAMLPFNAVNNFLGSGFFGYGMIMGERYAYQNDWPKIQKRLENGELIFNIMHEYTGTFAAVMMAEARIIMADVTAFTKNLLSDFISGKADEKAESGSGTAWFIEQMQNQNVNVVGPEGPLKSTTADQFIDNRALDAKIDASPSFTKFKTTQGYKQSVQQNKQTVTKINVIAKKIATRTPSQQAVIPFANGAAIYNRNKLIREIAEAGKQVSNAQAGVNVGRSSRNAGFKANAARNLDTRMATLNSLQLQLANVLAKWNWSRQ